MKTLHQAVKENFEIVPASLLPFKEEWEAISCSLPAGTCLIILPRENPDLEELLRKLAKRFEDKGIRAEVLCEDVLSRERPLA